jgi:hypothetical protein
MNVFQKMAVDRPTNASFTSGVAESLGNEGWLELYIPTTGAAVGTISIRGGVSSTQSTHDDLELDDTEIYAEGANIDGTPVTGIAYTAPGTLTLDGNLAAATRVRIPLINPPPYLSLVYARGSAGSATQYIQATWFSREDT